jgi:hypothetical protein
MNGKTRMRGAGVRKNNTEVHNRRGKKSRQGLCHPDIGALQATILTLRHGSAYGSKKRSERSHAACRDSRLGQYLSSRRGAEVRLNPRVERR